MFHSMYCRGSLRTRGAFLTFNCPMASLLERKRSQININKIGQEQYTSPFLSFLGIIIFVCMHIYIYLFIYNIIFKLINTYNYHMVKGVLQTIGNDILDKQFRVKNVFQRHNVYIIYMRTYKYIYLYIHIYNHIYIFIYIFVIHIYKYRYIS